MGQVEREDFRAFFLRPPNRRRAGHDFIIGMGNKDQDAGAEHTKNNMGFALIPR
jgi:hypothetical protein